MNKKLPLLKTTVFVTALLCAGATQAANYPDKPITLVVPYSAGGGADNAARIIAQSMSEVAGQSIVIENKGGASGSIGASYVARSAPDGYTVLYDASAFTINAVLRDLPYDIDKDFIPVAQAIRVPNILVTSANAPFNSLQDYIQAAKKDPGGHTFASYGPGSLAQMAGELLIKDTDINIVHIPYKGGAPALVDVMSGQVDVYFANAASSLNYVKTGKAKALAVTSPQRMQDLPEVPTMAESGVKNFDVQEWNGFFLPAGTPPEVVSKLHEIIETALKKPEMKTKLGQLGLIPVESAPDSFKAFLNEERKRWSEVVKTNNISVN